MKLMQYHNKSILFVMAAEAEYGPHLRALFKPLITGVGPVEAAVCLTAQLARLDCNATLPALIVSLGSAGSRTLVQTAVYQASSVSYRDMDASPLGFAKGKTPFLDLPIEVLLPLQIPGIAAARLSTGANIISGKDYNSIDADMVDMETWAHLRAATAFAVPFVSLRGISDGAAQLHHVDEWTKYLHIVDEKLAVAVDGMLKAIAAGDIRI